MSAPDSRGDVDKPDAEPSRQFMEIGGRSTRSIVGVLSYVLLFGAVCGVLVMLFMRFTGSLRLALGLVLLMATYMLAMGWWASRGDERSR